MTEIKESEKLDNYLDDKLKKRETERMNRILSLVAATTVGFCFSQVDVLAEMSPFASAFLATVPFEYCTGVFLGGVVGYLAAFPFSVSLKYAACLCFVCLARLILHKRLRVLEQSRFVNVIACFAVTVASIVSVAATQGGFVVYILAVLEGAIAFFSSYFFNRSFRTPLSRIGLFNLPVGDRLSLGISISTFVLCFSGVSVEGFSPARLICCLAVCFASYCKGASAGSVAGICLGAALSVDPEGRFIFPAFAMSGLISGAFAPLGQIAIGVSAALTFCGCCIVGGLEESFFVPMLESAVASAAFMLISPVWLSKVTGYLTKKPEVGDDVVNLQVSAALKKASGNILSFCDTVDEVCTRLDRVINPEVNKLFFEIQQQVCDGCSKKTACWKMDFDSTAGDILVLMGLEKRGKGKLHLEKHCSRLHELKRQVLKGRSQYSLSMLSKLKNREMSRLLTEQFTGMGDFLGELSEKIARSRTIDSVKSSALRATIIDSGVYIDALSCFLGDEGRTGIEIVCFERPFETDYKKIKNILDQTTGCRFDEPDINVTEMGTVLNFEEKSNYCLIAGSAQRPFDRGAPCGDSVAFCKRSEACSVVLLSDGMGTGSSAALDSSMAVSLTEKLLSGGFSFESSVKIVNSALIMKSTDESMATMDGLCVNLYTGKADFYKAGAAISFIRDEKEIFVVEESSLPLGILREVRFAKAEFELEAGNIVLMVSDGVTAGDCGWINDELLSWSTNNMDDLACHIVELAALRQDKFTGDDLTAVAVKLVKNR